MSEINEIIDGLIFIKDGTKVMSERETINKACDILAKVERGELVEIVRCKDCKYWQDNNAGYPHEYCKWNTNETPDADDFCSCGERSGKNEND